MNESGYLDRLLIGLLVVLLAWLLWWLLRKLRGLPRSKADRRYRESSQSCARISGRVYQRPDPMVYSQGFLMSQGLAVTWDNPDIHLELGGVPVDSASLTPATEYEIVARVWNGSNEAPAIDLPVKFSYLEFGIGTISHPIGQPGDVRVDLQIKGAPGPSGVCEAQVAHALDTRALVSSGGTAVGRRFQPRQQPGPGKRDGQGAELAACEFYLPRAQQ